MRLVAVAEYGHPTDPLPSHELQHVARINGILTRISGVSMQQMVLVANDDASEVLVELPGREPSLYRRPAPPPQRLLQSNAGGHGRGGGALHGRPGSSSSSSAGYMTPSSGRVNPSSSSPHSVASTSSVGGAGGGGAAQSLMMLQTGVAPPPGTPVVAGVRPPLAAAQAPAPAGTLHSELEAEPADSLVARAYDAAVHHQPAPGRAH